MPCVGGTLGNKWHDWVPSQSSPCYDHRHCGVLHAANLDLEVHGECPRHGTSKIPLTGMKLGCATSPGDDMLDLEMQCGCFPVGLTKIWVNLKTSGILSFTLGVHCYSCKAKGQVLMLVNKRGISCRTVDAMPCCRKPRLEFAEFRSRLLHKGDRTRIPLQDVKFAQRRSAIKDWQQLCEPVSGQHYYKNCITDEMAWQKPSLQILPVIPMENKWVALPGAEHDYYQYAQLHGQDRSVRVERLHGSRHNLVEVQIVDEDDESHLFLTRNQTVTRCPRCKHAIDRESGCNSMTCICGHQFQFSSSAF